MPFSIAAALVDGDVTPDTFEQGRFKDADVLRLIGMMSVDINADFSKQTPGIRNCRITATLDDGKTVIAHRKVTMAEIEAGTPDDVLERKFERLLRVFIPPDARRRGGRRQAY